MLPCFQGAPVSHDGSIEKGPGSVFFRFFRIGLDFLFPPRCAACSCLVQDANSLCPDCWSRMEWIAKPYNAVSGLPLPFALEVEDLHSELACEDFVYDCARSVALFGSVSREMVHKLKYFDRTDLAIVMARWMVRAGADCLDDANSWVAPVPLHRGRLLRRGFNQSALLSSRIARQCGLEHRADLLVRSRPTRQQVGLSEAEREINVQGAFRVHPRYGPVLSGRSVVLVDDVWTTGATLKACCRVLRRAGVRKISILTFARVASDL